MYRNLTFVLSLTFFFLIQVNASDMYEFVGTIQLIDKSIITYKIEFEEFEDGVITGKSITDFAGKHRTESSIRGKIDRANNKISFSEESNILTKSDYDQNDFCFIHIYNAKIKLKKKKSIIQGHFFSRYADGSLCIEGDIYLLGEEFFIKRVNKVISKTDKLQMKKKSAESSENLNSSMDELKNAYLNEDDRVVVNSKDSVVNIKIWDKEYLDGDRVSITKNDKIVLDNYKVIGKQKLVSIRLDQDTTTVKLIAMNEGRLPPNSANIEIETTQRKIPFQLRLYQDKEVTVLLVREY